MTYGSISTNSHEILAAAGLLDALNVGGPSWNRMVYEIDVVIDGALDENFEVRPEMADDVAAVLAEAIIAEFPERESEVSVYERGGGEHDDWAECLHSFSYSPDPAGDGEGRWIASRP